MDAVLFIEDDRTLRRILRTKLNENFLVMEAASGVRALEILKNQNLNFVLMDLSLPDHCGFELIKKIRAQTNIPIIVLSGEKDDKKKVKTLELGADEFVEKSCSPDLLVARINAHLRRYKSVSNGKEPAANDDIKTAQINVGNWVLDPLKFQLFDQDNNSAFLTAREYELLSFLISNAGRAIPRSELCEAIREENYVPTPRAIDVKVTRIRKKIKDDAEDSPLIQTVRGIGYMFQANISKS